MRVAILLTVALVAAAPVEAQQVIEEAGPVTHPGARTGFPEQVGSFRRTQVVSYNADRSDMSANYTLPLTGGRLLVSVYIYPVRPAGASAREAACAAEFDGVAQAIAQAYGGARQIERGRPPPVAGVAPEMSHRAAYAVRLRFDGEMRDVTSESRLYCDVGGRWLVKYRATSSAAYAPAVLDDFIAQGPWPGRAAAEPGTVAP